MSLPPRYCGRPNQKKVPAMGLAGTSDGAFRLPGAEAVQGPGPSPTSAPRRDLRVHVNQLHKSVSPSRRLQLDDKPDHLGHAEAAALQWAPRTLIPSGNAVGNRHHVRHMAPAVGPWQEIPTTLRFQEIDIFPVAKKKSPPGRRFVVRTGPRPEYPRCTGTHGRPLVATIRAATPSLCSPQRSRQTLQ